LITLDTTRTDSLSCYSENGADTPNLDRLAEEGVMFTNARCQVPLTLPSHTSILTGTNPSYHGVHHHPGFVSDKLTTLAELMKDRGYLTSAFISAAVLDSMFNLDQGFDYYYDQLGGGAGTPQRRADETIAYTTAWLETHRNEPFFAWLHLYDPHTPYSPPEPFSKEYKDPYLGEVAYMDSEIGKLLEFLKEENLYDNTLIIAVADHGEAFGEHSELEHGYFIYGTTIDIPLIMWCPGLLPEGTVIDGMVRSIDIMPTVLDIYGIKAPDDCEGINLLPVIYGDEELPQLESYTESFFINQLFGWAKLTGIEKGEYKFINTPQPELYNLKKDPEENNNIISNHIDLIDKYQTMIEDILKKPSLEASGQIDMETQSKLSSLGYISSGNIKSSDYENIDPKSKIEILKKFFLFKDYLYNMNFNKAEEIARELIRMDDRLAIVYENLGTVYQNEGRFDEAIEMYKTCLKLNPKSGVSAVNIGNIYLYNMNNIKDAEKHYIYTLDNIYDDQQAVVASLVGLASIAEIRNDYNKMQSHLKKALEINEDDIGANYLMISASVMNKNKEGVLHYCEKILKLTPPEDERHQKATLILSQFK
jgi:arylsulfatase A-like enzyme/Tfp pilus assembly protein PilF